MGIIGNRLVSDFSLEVSMIVWMQETVELESENALLGLGAVVPRSREQLYSR